MPQDEGIGHGSHVAGIIGAVSNNDLGIAGINWNVSIMALKAGDDEGLYDDDIIEAINYILDMKERGVNVVVVNASWGGYGDDPILLDAIKALGEKGIVFVAAAGNEGFNNDLIKEFPCSYKLKNMVCVGASDEVDKLAWFSNYGIGSVDIVSPGVNILSTVIGSPICDNSYFYDDMESGGKEEWGVVSGNWEITDENPHSGNYSWSDSPGGNYPNKYNAELDLSLDLSGVDSNSIICASFWADISTEEGFDHFYLSASNGTIEKQLLKFSGSTEGYKYYRFVLGGEFKSPDFKLKFKLDSDSSITYDGVYIDDVSVGKVIDESPQFEKYSGTSMSAPFVSGAIALSAVLYPEESVEDRIARVLGSVDKVDSLKPYVASEGRLNIDKALSTTPGPFVNTDNFTLTYLDDGNAILTLRGKGFNQKVEAVMKGGEREEEIPVETVSESEIKVTFPAYRLDAGRHVQLKTPLGAFTKAVTLSAWNTLATIEEFIPVIEPELYKTKAIIEPEAEYAANFYSPIAYSNGKIYMLGFGYTTLTGETRISTECKVYDTVNDSFENCTELPDITLPLDAKATIYDNKPVLVEPLNGIWLLDNGNWTSLARWEDLGVGNEVFYYSLNVYGSKILIVGGYDFREGNGIEDVLYYDFSNSTHGKLLTLDKSRMFHASVIVDDKLFVIGGMAFNSIEEGWEAQDNIEIYDLKENLPYEVVKLPVPIAPAYAVTDGRKIYIWGYKWDNWITNTVFMVFDISTQKITYTENGLYQLKDYGLFRNIVYDINKDKAFVVGGFVETPIVNSNSIEEINLPLRRVNLGKLNALVKVEISGNCTSYGNLPGNCSKDVSAEEVSDLTLPDRYKLFSNKAIEVLITGPNNASATVTVNFDRPLPEDVVPFKVVKGKLINISSYLSKDRKSLTLTITDNGNWDSDERNGAISDPIVLLQKETESKVGSSDNNGIFGCSTSLPPATTLLNIIALTLPLFFLRRR